MSDGFLTLFDQDFIPESAKPKITAKTPEKIEDESNLTVELNKENKLYQTNIIYEPNVELEVIYLNNDPSEISKRETLNSNERQRNVPLFSKSESDSITQNIAVVADTNNTNALELSSENELKPNSRVPLTQKAAKGKKVGESGIKQVTPAKKNLKKVKATGKPAINQDWKGDKQYYSIGEVADLFQVNTSHIRFWTTEFNIKVRTTKKGDRLYSPQQIKEIRTIYQLVKEKGFTLAGAKTQIKERKKQKEAFDEFKNSLLLLKEKLVILKGRLK